jgi:pyruvate carboxylase
MFEMVRSNNLKLDFSAQYFIQNDVHRQDIGYYKDKYVIPSLEMKFLKGDLGRVKIGCVKQITSSVPPYFIAQIEYRPSSILDYIESSGYAMERRKLRIKRREKRREERLERRYLRKHKIQSE